MGLQTTPRAVAWLQLRVVLEVLFGQRPQVCVLTAGHVAQNRADGVLLVLAGPAQLVYEGFVPRLVPYRWVDVGCDFEDQILVLEFLAVAVRGAHSRPLFFAVLLREAFFAVGFFFAGPVRADVFALFLTGPKSFASIRIRASLPYMSSSTAIIFLPSISGRKATFHPAFSMASAYCTSSMSRTWLSSS